MDQQIYDQVKRFITVYGDGRININTAPREVLQALGISDYVVSGILMFRKGGDMMAGTGDDDIFIQPGTITSRLSQAYDMSPTELASLSNLVSEGKFVTKSENFMIRSQAGLNRHEGMTTIVAVTDRTGKIKYWYEEI